MTDLTILILVRLDSISRLQNILIVSDFLCSHLSAEIHIREASSFNNGILARLLSNSVIYEWVEDNSPILHKTKHFNKMLARVDTKFVSIWDADVLCNMKYVDQCIEKLRNNEADMALPYNGVCLDTSEIIKELFYNSHDISIFEKYYQFMQRLNQHRLVGGAVIMNTEVFKRLGGENESYYGWGDDDFDRYIKFMNNGKKIFRTNNILFHLSHERGVNSNYSSKVREYLSKAELYKTIHTIP